MPRPCPSLTYRNHIAQITINATRAADHCTLLHAGLWLVGFPRGPYVIRRAILNRAFSGGSLLVSELAVHHPESPLFD
jgi:hypothetical protein